MVKKLFNSIKPQADQNSPDVEPPELPDFRTQIHAKYPIRHLNSRHKRWIEDLSEYGVYDKAEVIFESGENSRHAVYLLQGAISLKADDGKYKIIHNSDESALYPLARTNPRQYTATALKPGTVMLWVDRQLIRKCINAQLKDNPVSSTSNSYLVEIIDDVSQS